MPLSEDEKALLEELNRKSQEPDAEDFEIEVYDTNGGKGARIPFSKGKSWLFDNFGIGEAPVERAAPEPVKGGTKRATAKEESSDAQLSYFARKQQTG
jgi:hypothetical protein